MFLCAGHAKEATTKMSSLSGAGGGGVVGGGGAAQLFNRLYIQNGLLHAPRTFTIRPAPRTLRDMKLSFLGELPL